MTYESLDKIADAYIPLLAVVFFIGLIVKLVKRPNERPYLIRVCLFFVGALFISYGMMFLDNAIHLWRSLGLDYSTHTAVSLALVISICLLAHSFWVLLVGSFIVYALLMLYQQYHTFLDITSTALVMLILKTTLWKTLNFFRK